MRGRGLRVGAAPHTLRKDKGRYGIIALEVYGPRQTHWINYLRTIYAMNDGGRWVFGQSGAREWQVPQAAHLSG
jgi:hypothetical protein